MKYCLEFTKLWLLFTARKTDAIPMTAWGSLHYKPRRVWLLSTPLITLSTIIHHPHLEAIYLPLPLNPLTRIPIHFPWKQGWQEALLAKATFLGPAFSSLIAIPEGTAGNMGCKFPNKICEGMSSGDALLCS